MNNKNIVVFSAKVAKDLINKGYTVKDINPDNKLPIKTIFYFENTADIKLYMRKEHDIYIK